MAASDGEPVSLRVQAAVYGVGMFSTTMHFMAVTIVPLWVLRLDLSPFWLGLVLGARPVLPLFFSIHAGVLMDRIGGQRVLLFFALLGMIAPLLYPAMPWIWAIILLQLVWGLGDSMGWLGAQTLVGQLMQSRTVYAGRLSFASRVGNVVGPPMAGAAWDFFGPWGAFIACSFWGLGAVICALMLPKGGTSLAAAPEDERGRRVLLRTLLPSLSDYTGAFRLLVIPTVAITVGLGMMVHVGNNIQSTFYVVWLNMSGIPGTLIGVLISIASVAASAGSLMAAPLSRFLRPYWLLWLVVWAAILLIVITPVFGTFVAFAIVLSMRSLLNGVHQPLVITMMLKTAGAGYQGRAIGLRATANRVTSIGAPVLMGAVAEVVGIENSFYVLGVLASAGMLALAFAMTRHPEIHANAEEPPRP